MKRTLSIVAVCTAFISISSVYAQDVQKEAVAAQQKSSDAINLDAYRKSLQIKSGGYSPAGSGSNFEEQKTMMLQKIHAHEDCASRASNQEDLMRCHPMRRNNSVGGSVQIDGVTNTQNISPIEKQ